MKFYLSYLKDFSENEYNECFALMSETRKNAVLRYKNEKDRKLTVLGEHLARKAVSALLDVDGKEVSFDRDENGKPFVLGLDAEFSISHSGEVVVCAVDKEKIGIDIEMIRPINLRVTKIACTENEKEFVFSEDSEEEKRERFFKIWTAKEAYFKWLGTGITKLREVEYSDLIPFCEVFREGDYIITIYKKQTV